MTRDAIGNQQADYWPIVNLQVIRMLSNSMNSLVVSTLFTTHYIDRCIIKLYKATDCRSLNLTNKTKAYLKSSYFDIQQLYA